MCNKFRILELKIRYNGEILIGELEYLKTGETLKFYYSHYEDYLYPRENKPFLVKELNDEGILSFIKDTFKDISDIDSYMGNHVA